MRSHCPEHADKNIWFQNLFNWESNMGPRMRQITRWTNKVILFFNIVASVAGNTANLYKKQIHIPHQYYQTMDWEIYLLFS